jgi:hypothetical protein
MIILETRYLLDIHEGTIVYTDGQCMIQKMILDDTTLEETIIPVLYENNNEMGIIIDDTLSSVFKSFKIVYFDDTHAHFGEISYRYQKGDVLSWGTRLPELIGIMDIPQIFPEKYTKIEMVDDMLIMNDSIKKKFFFKIKHFEDTIHVNMDILKQIFLKHNNQTFKLYLEAEFPICIEFVDRVIRRYYVAPLEV